MASAIANENKRNSYEEELAANEKDLAGYLLERIKPGLSRSAIPLLARSIAKEIAHREHPNGAPEDAEGENGGGAEAEDEDRAEAEDDHSAEAVDEHGAEAGAPPDFQDNMHELQAELGQDWILRFSVHGDDSWLTAEKDDGSQRVEAPTASVLSEAVELLNEGGGRSR
jgi:hypothetical protein